MLNFQNYSLHLQERTLLSSVDFSIHAGETVALIGESGSGKSLMARAALQVLPPKMTQSGAITWQGQSQINQSEKALQSIRGKEIGFIAQDPFATLNPLLSIGAQIVEVLKIHNAPNPRDYHRLAREYLDHVGLAGVELSRYAHSLSGGQLQRVAMAMALIAKPKLLIADEPTTALDLQTQKSLLQLLKTLIADEGIALWIITHDLSVAAYMADRVYVLKSGKIVETGQCREVFQNPQSDYTQELLEGVRLKKTVTPISSTKTQLLVENIFVKYPQAQSYALENISFSLKERAALGIVGESGSGKSTLARAVLGLLPFSQGKITLDEISLMPHAQWSNDISENLGVVFQDPNSSFNPFYRVEWSMKEAGHGRETPISDEEIDKALLAVGLKPNMKNRYIHQFSGGEKQRLAIARALLLRPKIVIFDEAVTALDVHTRKKILELIANLARDYGLSYIFISHDIHLVRAICNDVLVLKSGQVVEYGAADAILRSPKAEYTQALLEASLPSPLQSSQDEKSTPDDERFHDFL